MASKLLKPARAGEQFKTLSIKIPLAVAEPLAALQARVAAVGLTMDLDGQLSRALTRMLKAAERELDEIESSVTSRLPQLPGGRGQSNE